ncbi:MAG TPA: winged helix-turn-helix domain-containing protein [Dokdonella sp.]|uniref:winged helix-turn-helix domain-containing protein n=1 Tax=Dokdonella sp. TaxID=2291710 RepID=UPI002D8103FF|nr:winged helix-turn-helix domain-containing protein [Dokdonella sp.]HET9032938.1 winged helix-turn-helix domain-containing protein [Dokdonella sp.]
MRYSFGDFALDAETGELLRSGEVVALRRQTFRLLQLLIERAPALLSRDTLLDEVWGRTALATNAVPQSISELRRALGDDAQSPQFIETRHGRGYRFLAPVQLDSGPRVEAVASAFAKQETEAAPSDQLSARKWSWLAWSIAAASILLIAVWIAPVLFRVTDTASRATPAPHANALVLAVLPADAGVPPWVAPAALELFGQHLANSRLRLLRSDALGLADSAQDVRWQHQAHDLLDADHALGGRWHVEADGALTLDLSLIDLADGRVVVSRRIEGSPENLGALVAKAGSVIATALRIAPLDDSDEKQKIGVQDGADYWRALSAISAGHAEQAVPTLAGLHARLGKPQWMNAALIKAYVLSGDRDSAIALLESELVRKLSLPLGQHLRLQAEVATLRFEPATAAAAYRALADLYPDDVESRIHLVESEIDSLQGDSARKSLAQLAALPAARNDPRLTLLRARIARLDNDFAMAAREAAAALQIAQQYDLLKLAVSAALEQAAALNGQGQIAEAARLLAETDEAWSTRVDVGSLLDLRLRRVQLLREQGHLVDAQQILDQLQSDFTAALPRARIGIDAALVQALASQVDEADATLQRIKPAIDRWGDPDLSIGWLNADAIAAIARNDTDRAQQSFAQAFALARTSGRAGRHVALQVNAGLALMRQKRTAEAEQQWQQALETFEALGDRRGQATCLGNLAASASSQGQLERSVELNTRALAFFRDLHLSGPQARTAYNLALGASRDGKLGVARDYYKEAGDAWQADGQDDLALRAAVGQADIALISGDAGAASRAMDEVAQVESASALSRSHVLAMKAQIALALGKLAESRQLQAQALALRKHDGSEGWIALSELELLRNDLLTGADPVHVQVASETLARRFAALGEARDEARAWLLVIDAQLTRGKTDDARRSLDKVKAASQSFSDRTLGFDVEWADAWLGDSAERSLRLRSLQARATEQGYLLAARRAEQIQATATSGDGQSSIARLPLFPYARMGDAKAL